ncbi:uncharacterized protein I206_100009 [Kwoniella pini CBS 10737]|uniref:FAD/NAD(P)-binding domain-containing protein n=1 Tax=Kwoniella pini CBS 10737 TaxID=1296096 RepID=A0A1B9HSB6_9TREE|nr:uncharacterized protein I206_07824 [Kwoniella pini CBS 10737]OCF46154.1 hypothetical protein I206_07824 [Kwoniella pini CBS 10737]
MTGLTLGGAGINQTSDCISVLVVGAGPAGLVNARTPIEDGFEVTIVTKEDGVGGCWHHTYPDLATNSPWGAFTFSGLDMPKPASLVGDVVPVRTYRRYLEDFYHHFIKDKAELLLQTEVTSLEPKDNDERGWSAPLKDDHGEVERSFDRVVLATGYLGKPFIPDFFQNSPIPTFHTSALSYPCELEKIHSLVGSTNRKPTSEGDENTIVVIGGGKSGMDVAALLANRGKKVIWTFRGPLKWYSPTTPPGMMGINRLDILFGPSRTIDSWAMWFYHCTNLGAGWVKGFWGMMRSVWTETYVNHDLPPPETDPFLSLAHFAGGLPSASTDFLTLLKAGKIASLHNAIPISVDKEGIEYKTENGNLKVKCGVIVTATGYRGGNYEFIESKLRRLLGLDRFSPEEGHEQVVLQMRRKWKTINSDEIGRIPLPLVYRGILPLGRFSQRDLAITGATKPFSIPAITYEVESHWISSLFKDDPFLKLPQTEKECLKEIQSDNNFTRARYPNIDPYEVIPSGTYFSGFNDLSYSRVLLRDMSLDPWRQKDPNAKWWKFWSMGWLDVRSDPEQYATLAQERQSLRATY